LKVPPVTVPAIIHAGANPSDWLRPVDNAVLTFKVYGAGAASGISFRPLYDLHHQRYAVYWPLQVPEKGVAQP
jgi:hypothetical protein